MRRHKKRGKQAPPKPVDLSVIQPADYDEQERPFEDVLRRLAPPTAQPKDDHP